MTKILESFSIEDVEANTTPSGQPVGEQSAEDLRPYLGRVLAVVFSLVVAFVREVREPGPFQPLLQVGRFLVTFVFTLASVRVMAHVYSYLQRCFADDKRRPYAKWVLAIIVSLLTVCVWAMSSPSTPLDQKVTRCLLVFGEVVLIIRFLEYELVFKSRIHTALAVAGKFAILLYLPAVIIGYTEGWQEMKAYVVKQRHGVWLLTAMFVITLLQPAKTAKLSNNQLYMPRG